MALGNHEFDQGSVNLERAVPDSSAASPSSPPTTVLRSDRLHAAASCATSSSRYTIFNVDGLKIGVIGMGNLSSIQGIIEGGNSLGFRPHRATQAITRPVTLAAPAGRRARRSSRTSASTRTRAWPPAPPTSRDQNAAVAIDGVDVIFGGHLHIVLNPPEGSAAQRRPDDGTSAATPCSCHSGAFAKYVGRLDLVVHVGDRQRRPATSAAGIKSFTYTQHPDRRLDPDDPAMDEHARAVPAQDEPRPQPEPVYAVVRARRRRRQLPQDAAQRSRRRRLAARQPRRHRRCACAAGVEAEFALTNSLGIRADFESGPLNLEQMYNVFPFENIDHHDVPVGRRDPGDARLRRARARPSAAAARRRRSSGIYFDMVCAGDDTDCNDAPRPAGERVRQEHLSSATTAAWHRRTVRSTRRCKPLDPSGLYRVAVNDYIASGGSGFAVLKRNTTKFNTGISLRDALVDYIRTLPNRCTRPSQYTNIVGVHLQGQAGRDLRLHRRSATATRASPTARRMLMSPEKYDYTGIACLGPDVAGARRTHPDVHVGGELMRTTSVWRLMVCSAGCVEQKASPTANLLTTLEVQLIDPPPTGLGSPMTPVNVERRRRSTSSRATSRAPSSPRTSTSTSSSRSAASRPAPTRPAAPTTSGNAPIETLHAQGRHAHEPHGELPLAFGSTSMLDRRAGVGTPPARRRPSTSATPFIAEVQTPPDLTAPNATFCSPFNGKFIIVDTPTRLGAAGGHVGVRQRVRGHRHRRPHDSSTASTCSRSASRRRTSSRGAS